MGFLDTIKERLSNLETKHYYMIGGAAAVLIVIIILLVALSGFPGERFGDYSHDGAVARFIFNSSGSRLASSERSSQAKVFIWDVSAGKRLQAADGNKKDSRMIAFTQDGAVLVTAGLDERAYFWDIDTGSKRRDLQIPLSAVSVLSPDGTWLIYSKGPKTFVSRLQPGEVKYDEFDGNATSERAMAFSPDSSLLATGDSSGVLRLYEPEKKGLRGAPQKGHESAIACVAFSPEGKIIGTASRDNTAKIWDTEGKELAALAGHEDSVEVIAIGPDARLVLTGSKDRTARLWDGKSGKELHKLENFLGTSESMLAISADGSLAAIETPHSGIEIFDTDSGTSVVKLEVPVSVFVFAPTGSTLFCGLSNGKIYTWTKSMK